jgi:hypothetical protein
MRLRRLTVAMRPEAACAARCGQAPGHGVAPGHGAALQRSYSQVSWECPVRQVLAG